jgi:hypothetical protein
MHCLFGRSMVKKAFEVRRMSSTESAPLTSGLWVENYLKIAAGVLFLASVMRIWSLATGPQVLLTKDPLIGLELRWLMLGESALEVVAAASLISRVSATARLLAVLWLGTIFGGYHVALAIVEPGAFCPCLGTLYGRFGISPGMADMAAKITTLFFLVGSAVLLTARRLRWHTDGLVESKKLPVPSAEIQIPNANQ